MPQRQSAHEATRHAWMTVMLILAAVMLLLGFYHMRMLPSGGAAASGAKSARGDVGAVGGGNQGFLLEEAHLVLYSVHYPLSPCRGFCHEDCPSFLEGGAFRQVAWD